MTQNPKTQSPQTPPAPLPAAPLRLPVPQDQAVFRRLSTDFYPWTEVLTELETLQQQGLTGVLDVEQQGRWARFVWVSGQLLGGLAASGSEVTLDVAMRGLPRAWVTLTVTDPLVAEVLWDCRRTPPRQLPLPWPAVHAGLQRERFQGVLLAGPHCSFWEGGRVTSGALPPAGAACYALSSGQQHNRELLISTWREVLAVTAQAAPRFEEVWKGVSMQLAGRHPVLDPFAGEVTLIRGRLAVEEDVPMQELLPALLGAYRMSLRQLRLDLRGLPLDAVRGGPGWAATGLETL